MGSSERLGPVPFSVLLERVLEPHGYRLTRIIGNYRFFDPPVVPGRTPRRIGFPVEGGLVERSHVEGILKILGEDFPEQRH